MKAKILAAARRVFSQYGYHGATTRTIAKEVGIDISTLYYHWGEKGDLYEAVLQDIAEDLRQQLIRVEKAVKGRPLAQRLDLAIDMMADYYFEHPEISNLTFFSCFRLTRPDVTVEDPLPDLVDVIIRSMGLAEPDGSVSHRSRMRIWCVTMAIHNLISGEEMFRSLLGLDREAYVPLAKETLKFMLVPAFAALERPDFASGDVEP